MKFFNQNFPSELMIKNWLVSLYQKEDHFAKYKLDSSTERYGKLGDQSSESNHSSICAHIKTKFSADIESLFFA